MSHSGAKLWGKLRLLPKKGLGRLVECVVLLWVLLADPAVPTWAKVLIAAALAYLICPFDGIPDFLPAGLTDDAALLLSTAAKASGLVTGHHRRLAAARRRDLGI